MKENRYPKVTILLKDGTLLKEAYIQFGEIASNGDTIEEVEKIMSSDSNGIVAFTTNHVQGHFILSQVEMYSIKPVLDIKSEINDFVYETNFYRGTDNLEQYLINYRRSLTELLKNLD